jgi:YD repeat-containing protein
VVDGFHHVTQHNDPAGKSTLYRYDANGELTKITDPRSKGTIYTRNGFGDVVSLVSPDTGTTTFTYDSAGNVLTRKDAKGQTLTYRYDALNRLTDVSSSVSGESATTFSYDGTPKLVLIPAHTNLSSDQQYLYM